MLKVERVTSPYLPQTNMSAEELFRENRSFIFTIDAPFMWWLDIDGLKYGFVLDRFAPNDIPNLPLSTNVQGMISLTYQEIVEICEDYVQGLYKYINKPYQFPNEQEWKEFCETLFKIRGIKDLLEDE